MPIPLIIAGLAIATAASIIAPEVGKRVAVAQQKPQVQKELAKPQVQQILQESRSQVSQKQPALQVGPIRFSAYDLPTGPAWFAGQTQSEVQKRLIAQGYSKSRAAEIAAGTGAIETGAGIGEGVGLLGISAGSASAATKLITKGVTKAAAKTGGQLAKKTIIGQTIKGSAIAGAYEGGASTIISTSARQDRLPTPAELLFGTAAGAGTAAAGGGILSASYLKSPKVGGVLDWVGSSAVDVLEKPGDVLAGKFVRGPSVVRGKGGTFSLAPTTTPTTTTTPTQTSIQIPTLRGKDPVIGTPITPAEPVPPVTRDPPPPPPTPTPTPTQTPQPEPTPTPTPTPTITPSSVPVPASTIMPRQLPPVAPLGALPGTPAGYVGKSGLGYYNELRKGRILANRLIWGS